MNNPWRFFRACLYFIVGLAGISFLLVAIVLLAYGYGFRHPELTFIGWILLFFSFALLIANAITAHSRDPESAALAEKIAVDPGFREARNRHRKGAAEAAFEKKRDAEKPLHPPKE